MYMSFDAPRGDFDFEGAMDPENLVTMTAIS